MIRVLAVALVAVALFASGAFAQTYRLQPGDTIEVSVLEDPALNRQALVRPDGRISLPLAGTLTAAGRTPEQVQAAIQERLSRDFVTPPTVTVALVNVAPADAALADETAAEPAVVYVLGEVAAPGAYQLERPADVLQVLALSGGVGVFAARDRIQVRRRDAWGETVILFDYDGVESGAVPSARVTVRDGDVIIVPERGLFD